MNRRPAVVALTLAVAAALAGCAGSAPSAPVSLTPVPSSESPTSATPTASVTLMPAPTAGATAGVTVALQHRTGTPPADLPRGPIWTAIDPAKDASSLTLTWIDRNAAAGCGAVDTAWVTETSDRVVVELTRHAVASTAHCAMVETTRTATVPLAAPLGDRTLSEPAQ